MRRLYLSASTEATLMSAGPSILVGQRCLLLSASSSSADAAPCSAYAVAECVACDDPSVVEEQVECLERVLPFGIEVLGLSGTASDVAELAAHLRTDASKEWVSVVHRGETTTPLSCRLLRAPSAKVEVTLTADVLFVEVQCALHSHEHALPLLVLSPGASPTIVDGESDTPLKDDVPYLANGAHTVQLGAVASTLRLHVVLAPAFVSAKGMHDILWRQINAAFAASTTRLVEVQSHNTHISYCCRVEAGTKAEGTDLSAETLEEVFEMIEDATGAAAKRNDVRGCLSIAPAKQTAPAPKSDATSAAVRHDDTTAKDKETGNDTLLLVLGLAIAVIGVLVAVFR